jgi:DNA polymerase-3 subunit delta'
MATNSPLLHPVTAAKLASVYDKPPHALLLTGPAGMGKGTVAQWLAARVLDLPTDKLDAYPHFLQITSPDGKGISIDAIRELEHVLALKIPGTKSVSRVIVINDAHLLTTEAQNSLLKTLEEPPEGTILLLTSSQQEALLPTIRSRVQTIEVNKPATNELQAALTAHGLAVSRLQQVLALSGGLPGLAHALADDDQEHPLVSAAQIARRLLQQSTFEKLCQVDSLAKNRETSRNVVQILMQMAHAALLSGKGGSRWQRVQQAAYDAQVALARGTQPKLVLTDLMLNL